MKKIAVKFMCESKEECYDLTNKILNDKVLVKCLRMNNEMMKAFPGKNIYYFLDFLFANCPYIAIGFASPYLMTSSKKVLQRIRKFIKDNHCDNKYEFRDTTDGSTLRIDFDDMI